MVYKLNKITIKLKLKNETRNRPVKYTNMYLDSDLNFFLQLDYSEMPNSKCLKTKGRNLVNTYFVLKDICVKYIKFALC